MKFGNNEDLDRLKILRNNIVKYSQGEFENSNSNAIYVDWNWINYFEIRLEDSDNIRLEIWVADVKHQWNDLSKVSSMSFVSKQQSTFYIKELDMNVPHYIGAYIKLGDTYGKTLKVANFEIPYVRENFNKEYYKNFYKMLGGKWEKNIIKEDFVKGDKLLISEFEELNLIENDKKEIIDYIKNETRNVLNLSLGTTINITIPIKDFIKHDANFDGSYESDKIAMALYKTIIEYKEIIEDERKNTIKKSVI